MITAKDELKHLAECLSEEEAEKVISLLRDIPECVHHCTNVRDSIREANWNFNQDYLSAAFRILTYVKERLEECSSILPRE